MTLPFAPDPASPDDPIAEGPPEPIVEDSLAEPDPQDIAPPEEPAEVEEPPVPDEAATAAPIDQPVVLGAETEQSATALGYLRDATPDGVLIHVMITADGTEPVDLGQLELGAELADGQAVTALLPAVILQPQETWEADVLLDAVVEDLAPGTSVLRWTLLGQADQYSTL